MVGLINYPRSYDPTRVQLDLPTLHFAFRPGAGTPPGSGCYFPRRAIRPHARTHAGDPGLHGSPAPPHPHRRRRRDPAHAGPPRAALPTGPGRRHGQGRRGRPGHVRPGLRLRRDRHRDTAPAAGQRGAAPVEAHGGARPAQPHGIQQRGRGRGRDEAARAARDASRSRRHRRGEHRQEQGHPRGRRPRGLRVLRPRPGPLGGLRRRQRLLAEHARPARPAIRRSPAPDPAGRSPRLRGRRPRPRHAPLRQDRTRPGGPGHRRDRRAHQGTGAGGRGGHQHDDQPRPG